MTASIADVIAQLLEVRTRLTTAAVTAMRAKADAEQAHSHYHEAAKGTDHPQLTEAITDITIAADKSAKVARLLTDAEARFATYLNRIAPGSVPKAVATDTATPSGERLLEEADQRAETKRNVASFLSKSVRNAESMKDATKTITELGEKGVRIFRSPSGPSGSQSTGAQNTPTVGLPEARPKIDVPDAVSQLIVVGWRSASRHTGRTS